MRALLALALLCGGCEAIDDFTRFHVVGDDGGSTQDAARVVDLSAVVGGPTGDAGAPDFAGAEDLAVGPPQDMQAAPGDMLMPCVIGQSLIGGCFIAN